jgi:hypothetical protein
MLKRCWTALAAVTILSGAHAAPLPPEDLEECKDMAEIARSMMDLRQRGVSMSRLMEVASNEEDPYWKGVFQYLVEQAFQRQRYDSLESRALAVSEFEDVAYMGCYQRAKSRNAKKQ